MIIFFWEYFYYMDCLARYLPCLPCFSRPETNRYEMLPSPYTPDTLPQTNRYGELLPPYTPDTLPQTNRYGALPPPYTPDTLPQTNRYGALLPPYTPDTLPQTNRYGELLPPYTPDTLPQTNRYGELPPLYTPDTLPQTNRYGELPPLYTPDTLPQTNRYGELLPPYTPDTMPHGSAVSPIINPVQGFDILGIPSPTHTWETTRVRPLSENWRLNRALNYNKAGLLELKSLYSFDESDDHPVHQLASKFDEIWRLQESLKKEFGETDVRDIINTMLTRADIDEVLVPRLSHSGELVVTVKIKAHDTDTHIIKHLLFDNPFIKNRLFRNLYNLHNGNIVSSLRFGSENGNSDFDFDLDITKPWKSLIDLVRDDFIQSFSTAINELRFPAQHPIRQFCLDLETVFTTQDNALKDSPGHTIQRLIQTKVTQKI